MVLKAFQDPGLKDVRPIRDVFAKHDEEGNLCMCGLSALFTTGAFKVSKEERELFNRSNVVLFWAKKVFGISYTVGFSNGWDGKEPPGAREKIKNKEDYNWGWEDGQAAANLVFKEHAA